MVGPPVSRSVAPAAGRGGARVAPVLRQDAGTGSAWGALSLGQQIACGGVLAICLAVAAAITASYPLAWPVMAAALVVYAAVLWLRPAAWLLVIPAVLPALDLAPWTGWLYLQEPDLFVLVTIGVLACRTPPAWRDFRIAGPGGTILWLVFATVAISVLRGLTSPIAAPGGSSNPYLQPENALRMAKGLVCALALLPFFQVRIRTRGDALRLFAAGMVAGLACVATAAIVERALFPGLLNFTADYRIVATFSSMHLGGGHVGGYLAMAMPFLVLGAARFRAAGQVVAVAAGVAAAYALIVTFARTAYFSVVVAITVTVAGLAWSEYRHGRRRLVLLGMPVALGAALVGLVIAVAFDSSKMSARLSTVLADLDVREANWTGGLELMDDSVPALLFGMGLGTYPRAALHRPSPSQVPANFHVVHTGNRQFLDMQPGTALYFGQKVSVEPDHRYRLALTFRSPDGEGVVVASLCDKILLYSDNCRPVRFAAKPSAAWNTADATLDSGVLGAARLFGLIARPVELSLFDSSAGVIDISRVSLIDDRGINLIANGDFAAGTERWYFTDDAHLVWQMKDQYLMSLFESGILGLAGLLLLAGAGIAGAIRAAGRGEPFAVAVAGSIVAFLCASVFDYLLVAPRLATLFYLVAMFGISLWHKPVASVPPRRSTVMAGLDPAIFAGTLPR